jgi:hypothetical protein
MGQVFIPRKDYDAAVKALNDANQKASEELNRLHEAFPVQPVAATPDEEYVCVDEAQFKALGERPAAVDQETQGVKQAADKRAQEREAAAKRPAT